MAERRVSFIISANIDRWQKNLNKAQRQMDKFGRNMQRVGRSMTTYITAPTVAAGGAAIKMASDFESSLSKVEGLVGLAREEVQGMRGDVLRLAGETARAPQELADALFFVTSAGLRGADAINVLEASARAAAAGLGETKDIADLVTSATNAYGIENLSAAQATDTLVAAVREGKAEASDLAQSMGQVLPIASNLGVTFDQVGAAVAAMTRTGTNAQTASMQLRQILASLLKPTTQAEKAMREMGTSSATLRKTLREDGLVDVLGFLREQMETNEQAMAKVFPNIRALSGALDIMGANAEENVGIFDRMQDSTGSLDKAFGAAADTTEFKFNQALANLKAAAIELGDVMLPVANKIITAITGIIKNFVGLEKAARIRIVKIAGLLAVSGPLLIAIGTAAKVIAGFATLALGKIGIIAAGFIALVGTVKWVSDNWQTLLSKMGGWMESWANKAGGWISKVWNDFIKLRSEMGEVIREGLEYKKSQEALAKRVESTMSSAQGALHLLNGDMVSFIGTSKESDDKLTSWTESVKDAWGGIAGFLSELTGADQLMRDFNRLFEDTSSTGSADGPTLGRMAIPDLPEGTSKFIKEFGMQSEVAGDRLDGLSRAMIENAKVSTDVARPAMAGMVEEAVRMGQALQSTVASAITSFADTLGDAFTGDAGASGFFRNILLVVADFGKQLGRMLVAAGVASLAFQKLLLDPLTAIAAGTALIVASTAAANLMKEGPTRKVNDAMITSRGEVIEFHPDDNILAMKDFSGLSAGTQNVNVTGQFRLAGTDLVATIEQARSRTLR